MFAHGRDSEGLGKQPHWCRRDGRGLRARPLSVRCEAQHQHFTCCHDDAGKNFPACVRRGEVVRQIPKLIQHQAGHGIG